MLFKHRKEPHPKKWPLMLWTLDLDDSLLEDMKRLQFKYVVPVITLTFLVEVRKFAAQK